ncbi:MAG: bifunctional (p)ppGpp synthetase/guanosine-3',5'-bis(diphosphate) 3'-pyrophosphohydrolase [Gammaproteobacteria bacterium]|nr:bifunctional (p)ppGpp synthetase/guanosine-3',5'-bis(diphosphate) 3'-pyrophosphohydrolase [Gammaproteobacteria bacterium]
MTFPKCCHPIPGDKIIGVLTAGRGMVVHRQGCSNVPSYETAPEKWVDVEWSPDLGGDFKVELALEVINQRGVLANVAATVADEGANIDEVETREREEGSSVMNLIVSVSGRKQLADVLRRLHAMKSVTHVQRRRG